MNYFSKIECEIKPTASYQIIKNCAGCGCKSTFVSTGNFRVNANGNRIDVWLIYQCDTCKHTYNLTIHERVRASELAKEELQSFLTNDEELAFSYGTDKNVFARNKAEIDRDKISYEVSLLDETEQLTSTSVVIRNPYDLKLRLDKVLSELFKVNRNRIKNLIKDKTIVAVNDPVEHKITVIISETVEKNEEISNI